IPPLSQKPTPTSKVKRLYLCRHGETELNANGVLQGRGVDQYLNETGRKQAELLRDRFANVPIDVFVSSRLKRAKQTAEIVKQNHPDAPLVEIEGLAEISWGDWEGEKVPALNGLLASWEDGKYDAKSPSGESPMDVEERSVPALYGMLERPEQTFLVVVHGRLLRIMMSSIFYHTLRHMQSFTHHNTTVNIVDVIIETD
ncbi:putative phosphoglycerate mutase, partial [Blyttiomyces helicus]